MRACKSHIRANSEYSITALKSTEDCSKGWNWKVKLSIGLPFLWTAVVVGNDDMSNSHATDITLAHSEENVSVEPGLQLYPQYKHWENAFRDLTGWPPEAVAEEELRGQLASGFPAEGLKHRSPEAAVPIEKAVQVGLLNRNPEDGRLQLATVESVDLEIGGRVIITQYPSCLDSDTSVSVERT